MTERAVGYARLSQEGKSIPEQIEAIEDYCESHGFDLIQTYNDGQQESGYTDQREKYQELLSHLRDDDRPVDHVVVRGLSRLSRDRLHRMQLLIELHREGVDVHAYDRGSQNPIDLSKPWALTREAGQADADDVEKRKEAERGRQEAERRKAEGLPNGRPPFGLTYDDNKERLIPSKNFETATRVLDLLDEGYSYRAIAASVNVSKDQVGTIKRRRGDYERAKELGEAEPT